MTGISSFSSSYNNYNYQTQSTKTTTSSSSIDADLKAQLEEFEKFKAQNYKEVEAILNSSSSKFKSGSIEVTAGALLRMQSDPAFKDEMMRLLQEDADATHNWTKSGESHIKIDENGYTGHSKSFLGDDLELEQAKLNSNFTSSLFGGSNGAETLDKDQYKYNQNQSLIKKMQDAMNETKKVEKEKSEKLEKEKKAEKLEEDKKADKLDGKSNKTLINM